MISCRHQRIRSSRTVVAAGTITAAAAVALLLASLPSPALAFDYDGDGTDDGVFDFKWDTSPVNCAASGLPTCQNNGDCKDYEYLSAYGMDPFCGTVECHEDTGTCGFHAWRVRCFESVFVSCVGLDSLCTRGPEALPFDGRCDGWENEECVYRWCPAPRGACCTKDSDCTADAGRLPFNAGGGCGEVKCNLETNKCEFNAYNENGECGEEYFVYCDGDARQCTKGPEGSVGRCTGHDDSECVYSWCPLIDYSANPLPVTPPPPSPPPPPPTAAPVPAPTPTQPEPCCTRDSDCRRVSAADYRKSKLEDCGTPTCNAQGICEFNAWIQDGDCDNEYYVWCDGGDHLCTRGPMGRDGRRGEGTCTGWGNGECIYTFCPVPKQEEDHELGCCSSAADCISYSDPGGRSSLSSCGSVDCNSDGRCEFNAWKDTGKCKTEYYRYCVHDHKLCNKGPVGSTGTCTGWDDMECVYTWCP